MSSGSASYNWSVGPTSIVNFNAPSDQYAESPNLYGVGGGSGSDYLNANGGGCSQGGSGNPPPTTQIPTALRVVQTLANSAYPNCPSGQAGWQRPVNRSVIDQSGHDIKEAGQTIPESITWNPGANNLNIGSVQTHTGVTDYQGLYEDNFWFCSPLCPGSSATSTATQSNTDILPNQGGTYNLTNSTIELACSYIKINGALTP